MVIIYDIRYAKYSFFFLFKALEDGGKYQLYSKNFSKCTRYAEMICNHFEKNCTAIEMKKKIIQSFGVCSYLAYNELCVGSALYVVFFFYE